MAIENSYNFRRIHAQLTSSGVVGANRLKGLAAEGYDTLINLLPDDNQHAVEGEGLIVSTQGVEYVYIPVDFEQPTAENYQVFAAALDAGLGRKLHIHCAANYRVSAFYSLYATARGLWTEAQAREFVQSLWNPQDYPAWAEFMASIGLLEQQA